MKTFGFVMALTLLLLVGVVVLVACSDDNLTDTPSDTGKVSDVTCDNGYHKNGDSECVLNQYTCGVNGEPFVATHSDRPSTNRAIEKCGRCYDGYTLNPTTFACVEALSYVVQPHLNGTPGTNTTMVSLTTSDNARLWWVVYVDGALISDSATLMADASGGSNNSVRRSGNDSIDIIGGEAYNIEIDRLMANTNYSLYAVIQRADTNEQVLSTKLDFATISSGVPAFTTQPFTTLVNRTEVKFSLTTSEQAGLYWVVYDKQQPNITATSIIDDAIAVDGDMPDVEQKSGSAISVDGNTPFVFTVERLTLLTSYYLYVALRDTDNNQSFSMAMPFDTIGHPYVCTYGTKKDGFEQPTANVEGCVSCNNYYTVNDSEVCVATVYVCEQGNVVSGSPAENEERITDAHVHKCAECKTGYHKDDDRCVGDIATAIDITAVSDTSIDATMSVDFVTATAPSTLHWVLYAGNQQSKTNAQIVTDATNNGGIARSGAAITINGNTVHPITINTLDASTTYTLYSAVGIYTDFFTFNTHGPNSKYGVDFDIYCTVDSGYIPTNFSDKLTGTNGTNPTEEWVPTFNDLGQLADGHRAQRECYKYAYYYQQSLPDIPPHTTAAHTNSLPPEMFYDHSKYKLVFEEDFGPNTTTNPHNTHNRFKIGTDEEQQVNLYKIFDGLQNNSDENFTILKFSHHNHNVDMPWPGLGPDGTEPAYISEQYDADQRAEIRAALQNEWSWPAYIKNGRFHAGMGRVSINHVRDNHLHYCKNNYMRKINIDSHVLNGPVPSCECDEDTVDGCIFFFSSWEGHNIKFQYGFLEIDVAELMIAAASHINYSGREPVFLWLPSHQNHTDFETSGTFPTFLDKNNDEGYLELNKVEFQLMEHYVRWHYGRGHSGWWLAKHFYLPSAKKANFGERVPSRFYDTYHVVNTILNPAQKRARKLGVEWTPAGYKIWEAENGGPWVVLSTTNPGDGFITTGSCGDDDITNGADGITKDFVQCGISHVVASLKHSGSGRPSVRVQHPNPMYVFNHFRIYQPEGNYAEIERVYK